MATIFRHLAAAVLLAALPCAATAQSDEYFSDSWYNCDLSGHETTWPIKQYKVSLSWTTKLQYAPGHITFSETCVEIDCFNGTTMDSPLQLHFPVGRYERKSLDVFRVIKADEDEYFDCIEVHRGGGQTGYRVLLGKLSTDNNTGQEILENARLFICKPLKPDFPPQVPAVAFRKGIDVKGTDDAAQ